MNKKNISFKEEALQALTRGELKKALECFRNHCARESGDLRSRLKSGELLERLGRKEEAIQTYRKVAEAYTSDGFILQAISVSKMILRIDPSLKDVNDRVAQLYAEKIREKKLPPPFSHLPLFSELNETELRTLLSHIHCRNFQEDALICREGDAGDSLFAVSRGEVAVIKRSPGGKEIWLRRLKEGDFFGEFGFFMDQKRHATVKAVTGCEILEVSREEFHEMIRTHPRLNEVLQNLFKERVLDNFIALSPLFSSLTVEEREEVIKRFHPLKVPEETILIKGGEPPSSLYMVRSGGVEIFTQNRQGRRVLLAHLESGNIFGEIGLLFDRPRMANAKTNRPTELLEMTGQDFKSCLHRYPHLQTKLKEISSMRLARVKDLLSPEAIQQVREAMV